LTDEFRALPFHLFRSGKEICMGFKGRVLGHVMLAVCFGLGALLAININTAPCWGSHGTIENAVFSLVFKDEPLCDVIQKIADATGYEIRLNASCADLPVTAVLRHVNIHEGLRRILNQLNHSIIINDTDKKVSLIIYQDNPTAKKNSVGPLPRLQSTLTVNTEIEPIRSHTDIAEISGRGQQLPRERRYLRGEPIGGYAGNDTGTGFRKDGSDVQNSLAESHNTTGRLKVYSRRTNQGIDRNISSLPSVEGVQGVTGLKGAPSTEAAPTLNGEDTETTAGDGGENPVSGDSENPSTFEHTEFNAMQPTDRYPLEILYGANIFPYSQDVDDSSESLLTQGGQ
jgi:hypothetical protein